MCFLSQLTKFSRDNNQEEGIILCNIIRNQRYITEVLKVVTGIFDIHGFELLTKAFRTGTKSCKVTAALELDNTAHHKLRGGGSLHRLLSPKDVYIGFLHQTWPGDI
jgi:hypothetical protein